MKKIALNIQLILLAIMIFSIGLFIYQVRIANILREKLSNQKTNLREARSAERKAKEIEKRIADSKQKEAETLKKIPKNKESIFLLMKELAVLGNNTGIEDISFVTEKPLQKGNEASKGNIMRNKRNQRIFNRSESTDSGLITPHHFTISFAARYRELYMFIKKISSMKRVVSLEGIKIERNKKYFPRQKVTLKLTTYTFSSSE